MTSPSMMYAGGPGGDPYMGLLGTIAPQTQTSGLMQMPQQSYQPHSFGASPGQNWSQVAYQMAGSPNQNPFKGSVLPPASTSATSPSGGGATALGGTALGILGALGKAAGGTGSTSSNLGSAISGLMGGSGNPFGTYTSGNIANVGNVAGSGITNSYAPATAQYTSGLMGSAADAAGASGIAPVGTGAIDAAADAGATAAIPGLEAGGEAAGGLLGGSAAAASPALETVGTGAIDAAADAGVAEGAAATGGADAAGAGAGLGAGLGATAGLAAVLAPALIGMSTPAVQLSAKYWTGVQNSIQNAIASGDRGQLAQQVMGLLNQPQSAVPKDIQQLVYSTGFVPSSGWGTGYDPSKTAAVVQQAGGLKGGSTGNISIDRK